MDTRYFNMKVYCNFFMQSPYHSTFGFVFPFHSPPIFCVPSSSSSFHPGVLRHQHRVPLGQPGCSTWFLLLALSGCHTFFIWLTTQISQTCLSSMALDNRRHSEFKTEQQTWPLSITLIVTSNIQQCQNSSVPKLQFQRLKSSLLYCCL